jgi:hypothetical protein
MIKLEEVETNHLDLINLGKKNCGIFAFPVHKDHSERNLSDGTLSAYADD